MGYTCCVPHCKSGYPTSKERRKLSFYSFPKDASLKAKWIRVISRRDFTPTAHSKVCNLQFSDSDFVSAREDTNVRRTAGALKRRLLKPSAVPSIFPRCPTYMQSKGESSLQERIRHASSSSRLEMENIRLQGEIDSFQDDDIVEDLCTLKERFLADSVKPSGFILYPSDFDGKLLFVKMTLDPHPKIVNSVIVNDDLTFVTYSGEDNVVPSHKYKDTMHFPNQVLRYSDFLNLLAAISEFLRLFSIA